MKSLKLSAKKDGQLTKRHQQALSMIRGTVIHHSYYTGSGNYIRLVSFKKEIIDLLTDLGYKFTEGNDAPRGGQQGEFIKISSRAYESIKSL